MYEALRIKFLELETTNRKRNELAIHDGLIGAFRRGCIEGELRRLVNGVQRKAVHTLQCVGVLGPFGVTVSIGGARLERDETAGRLTHGVDKALYAARHGGRDRVRTYAQEQEQGSATMS